MFAQGFGKNALGRLYRDAAGEGGDEGAGNAPQSYSQAELAELIPYFPVE